MIVESHLWETADGKLVATGDPSAAFLKYPAGKEIPDDLARELGLIKAVRKPADKAVKKPRNKGA